MNRFGKIYGSIWTDDKFSKLTEGAKLLFIYLATSKDCNSLGFFKISLGAIQDEFGMRNDDEEIYTRTQIKNFLNQLAEVGLVKYQDKWLLFNRWLRWNAPQGSNMVKRLGSDIGDIIAQNPPVELVVAFLGTIKNALADMEGTGRDGKKFNYYELLKSNFPVEMVSSFLGSLETLKECLEGNSDAILSEIKDNKTASERHLNGVTTAKTNKNKNENKNKNNNENKNETSSLNSYSKDNGLPSISVFCADGQPGLIDPAVIGPAVAKYPEIDWDYFKAKIQVESYNNAPQRGQFNEYFSRYLETFVHDEALMKGATNV